MGQGIRMTPRGDGGLYVATPVGEDTLLVALDDQLRVRPGWPLLIEGRTCEIAADAVDDSVRAVCGDDVLGFEGAGRLLDGWPARLPQEVYPWAEPRVIGGDLYLVARTYDGDRKSATAWLIRVSRDGTVRAGKPVATKEGTSEEGASEVLLRLGPDGTGYLIDYATTGAIADTFAATVSAFGLDGMRPGWPIEFDSLGISAGFGRDGQVYLVQAVDDLTSRLRSEDRQGRTMWTVELPVTASSDWNGAAAFDVPAPPATGSQGTAFVVTDRGNRSAVYAIDPSGRITGRWQTHDGLAWAGFCEPCSTGCGHMRVVPVVGDDGTLYVALGGGSVAAVGPDGGTRVGLAGDATATRSQLLVPGHRH